MIDVKVLENNVIDDIFKQLNSGDEKEYYFSSVELVENKDNEVIEVSLTDLQGNVSDAIPIGFTLDGKEIDLDYNELGYKDGVPVYVSDEYKSYRWRLSDVLEKSYREDIVGKRSYYIDLFYKHSYLDENVSLADIYAMVTTFMKTVHSACIAVDKRFVKDKEELSNLPVVKEFLSLPISEKLKQSVDNYYMLPCFKPVEYCLNNLKIIAVNKLMGRSDCTSGFSAMYKKFNQCYSKAEDTLIREVDMGNPLLNHDRLAWSLCKMQQQADDLNSWIYKEDGVVPSCLVEMNK